MTILTIYAITITIMFLIAVCCFIHAYRKNHELKENISKLIRAFMRDSENFNEIIRNYIDSYYGNSNKEYKGDNNYEFE